MIDVLTIEREYGSGAVTVAQKVAERLGWDLWDQALTDEIARHLECDRGQVQLREEVRDPLYYRLFKSFLRGSYEGSLTTPNMKLADADGIRQASEQIIRRVADKGKAVIMGRGSAYYLHERTCTLHVFVYAPFEEKVRRLQSEGKSQADAIHLAETVDQERTAFIKKHFGIDWPSRQYFHLMINSTMGEDAVVETIVSSLGGFAKGTPFLPNCFAKER